MVRRLIISLVGFLFTAIMALALSLWFYPEWFIHERSIRWALPRFLPAGVSVNWTKLDLQIDSSDSLNRGFQFKFNALCAEAPQGKICLNTDTTIRVHLRWGIPSITLEDFDLQTTEISIPPLEPKMIETVSLKGRGEAWERIHFSIAAIGPRFNVQGDQCVLESPLQNPSLQCEFLARIDPFKDSVKFVVGVNERHWQVQASTEKAEAVLKLAKERGALIPAPFHLLKGSLDLNLQGAFPRDSQLTAELQLDSHLHSKNQRLRSSTTGTLDFRWDLATPKLEADLEVLLNDTKLIALPLFNSRALPALFPDKRFQSNENPQPSRSDERSQSIDIAYRVRVKNEKPIQVQNDITQAPVSIHVDFTLSSESPLQGTLRVDPVKLDLFRRTAVLEWVRWSPARAPNQPDSLSARIRVDYIEYTVFIDVTGSSAEPNIQLSSRPPLPPDDVKAVLLFGTPTAMLNSEDLASVSNFKGALVARAVNLLSLYFLASTRIESVNFNPATGAFQLRVQLPFRLGLQLGILDDQSRQARLRRHLWGNFFVETEIRQPKADGLDPEVTAYLNWVRRY
jgi:hypothetical protein